MKNLRIYGLIGNPLSHSFSKKYFDTKFKQESIQHVDYQNFQLDSIEMLPDLIDETPLLRGLNVTIPYKKSVLPYLHSLDEVATATGAVNTITIGRYDNYKMLTGYNTDVFGFRNALLPHLKGGERKALVLGTGGASEAVTYVLKDLGIMPISVSRNPLMDDQFAYHQLDEKIIKSSNIIVNTTPAGMFPDTGTCPDIPYKALTKNHILFDLVYNPDITLFLQKGKEAGAAITNGRKMLELQAERSWDIWNE